MLASVTAIRFSAQTALGKPPKKDSCHVDLSCPEYDFYAKRLAEYHGLIIDTVIYNGIIRSDAKTKKADSITIAQFFNVHAADSVAMLNSDKITKACQKDYADLQTKFNKVEKKANRRTTTIWALIGAAIIEAIIILIK